MTKIKLANDNECYYNHKLLPMLDTLIYNVKKDWDFVILISGDRMVRTGKSVLAMQIGAYIATKLETKFDLDHVFFDSQSMIDAAQELPKNSVILYDEARESLAANKAAKDLEKNLANRYSK